MVDGKGILDALLGAASTSGQPGGGAGGLGDLLNQVLGGQNQQQPGRTDSNAGDVLGQSQAGRPAQTQPDFADGGGGLGDLLGQVLGGSGGGLIDALKNVIAKNPGLAQSAAIGAAGLILSSKAGRGLAVNAAKLGGVALIGGLAYRALKSFQAQYDTTGTAAADLSAPQEYEPVATTSDGALKLVKAMIAAAMADGRIDDGERQRIVGEMAQSALSDDQAEWLNREMANPASVEQLAQLADTPQEVVEIYTAARIAIDADSPPNSVFLVDLARALHLPQPLQAELDKTVDGVKVQAAA